LFVGLKQGDYGIFRNIPFVFKMKMNELIIQQTCAEVAKVLGYPKIKNLTPRKP
jgi:hypothetical protein